VKLLNALVSAARGALWLVRAGGLREQLRQIVQVQELYRTWQSGDLRSYEQRVFSQNGEDGIIKEILRRIGVKHGFFVEIGVEDGSECNCARLVREESWSGVFLEAMPDLWARLKENYRAFPGVRSKHAGVTSRNIEQLLAAHDVPDDFDLLSIDIDGNDYWVWQAVERWQPRVVVIEYNANFPPPTKWVMEENHDHRWDGTNYYGASLTSLVQLGRQKGYTLVGTDSRGINAFFVRSELVSPEQFLDTALYYHYSPFKHPLLPNAHPHRPGPFVQI
jgi:hypothetical protein